MDEQYRSAAGLNWSTIKHILRGWDTYQHHRDATAHDTPAMRLGTLVHAAVLEPATFAPAVYLGRRAGKHWEEFQAENAGAVIVTESEYEQISRMADSVLGHQVASGWLEAMPRREHIVQWQHGPTGLWLKGLVDASGHGAFLDLKTTADPSPGAFARTCRRYLYHGQLAHYRDGLGGSPSASIIAVSSVAPYSCACYDIPEAMLADGLRLREQALDLLYSRGYNDVEYPTRMELDWWSDDQGVDYGDDGEPRETPEG
jgi:hypothetical protein